MRFSKMHGLGNDFIIIDSITQNINLTVENIKYLANRFYGIGCDQILIVEPPYDPEIDFHCRIYNADGTEVSQCGNGVRCVARFVYIKKLISKRNIYISTCSHRMKLSIINDTHISVNMGEPIFNPNLFPCYIKQYQRIYILFLPNQVILCGLVSFGNPHCVVLVESVFLTKISVLGPAIENHHYFPNKINVSFMEVLNTDKIRLRVHERGVGETQACGSAACAAVAVGIQQGLLGETVEVNLPGGTISIRWKGLGSSLYMVGEAIYVYDGVINF